MCEALFCKGKGKMELITIITPIYNAAKTLDRCIKSLINQTYKNIEIICVNDGSVDDSRDILETYAQKDSRIKVIHKEKNESSALARRTGFENSNGKFIVFVDSDDFIELDMLEKVYDYSVAGDFDIVFFGCFYYTKSSRQALIPDVVDTEKKDRIKNGIFGFGNSKMVCNKFVKREIYSKIRFAVRNFAEDVVASAQLLYYADRIGYDNTPYYHICWSDSSITRNTAYTLKRYKGRKANYEDIIDFCIEKFGNDLSIFQPELSERMAWIESKNPDGNLYTQNIRPAMIGLRQTFRALRKNGARYGWQRFKKGVSYYLFDRKVNRNSNN